MAKLRPADVLFWILAAVTLALVVVFVLVLSGGIAVDSATVPTEPAHTTQTSTGTVETATTTETTETEATATEATEVETTVAPPEPTPSTGTVTKAAAPAKKPARLATVVLTASRGDCWFQARAGSAQGRVLDERVLAQGESISIKGRSVWLTVGAAGNLDVTVNGKPRPLSAGTISVVLSAKGSSS